MTSKIERPSGDGRGNSVIGVTIGRVRSLLQDGAALFEVLPAEEFETAHIPGAENLPLEELTPSTVEGLDRRTPIVVYCNDFL